MEEDLRTLNMKFIERGMVKEDFEQEQCLKAELIEIMAREEIYWHQKSR